MRVRRLLLFVLVAMNLTLVCQGHAADGGHTGMHLSLLGELHPGAAEEHAQATLASQEVEAVHEPGHLAAQLSHMSRPTSLPIDDAGRNSDPALLSGASHHTSLSTLAVALLVMIAAPVHTFSLYVSSQVTWRSSSRRPPETPPPRLVHVMV
jgi:hypothetical protein